MKIRTVMEKQPNFLLLCFLLPFSLVILGGCSFSDDDNNAAPVPTSPTGPDSNTDVAAAGSCAALTAGIQCSDSSRCTVDGTEQSCAAVDWTLYSGNVLVQSRNAGPGDRVQFDGLAPGDFRIDQVARLDGQSDTEVYNITIAASASGFTVTIESSKGTTVFNVRDVGAGISLQLPDG